MAIIHVGDTLYVFDATTASVVAKEVDRRLRDGETIYHMVGGFAKFCEFRQTDGG